MQLFPKRKSGRKSSYMEGNRKHKNTDDRRAKRSRRLLKESLLDLMKEKDFRDISARDITDTADLNRGTFYLHYPDTQALLESIEDDIVAEAQALVDEHRDDVDSEESLAPVLLPLLDYIEQKFETIQLLLKNSNASSILDKMHTLIYDNSVDYARRRFQIEDDSKLNYFLSYVSFGTIGMVKEWADGGMTFSKEKLIAYADSLAELSAQALF